MTYINFRSFVTMLLVCIFCFGSTAYGQGFRGTLLGGINASQIDGDGIAGYNKWGFTLGSRVSTEVMDRGDVAIELLYSQRGSHTSRRVQPFTIQLNYLEIPLLFAYNDWFVEKGSYYKVRAEMGFSYGYLFQLKRKVDGAPEELTGFKKNDLAFVGGVGYQFNAKWGLGVRYTRSLTPVYEEADVFDSKLRSYFLTFRAEYRL